MDNFTASSSLFEDLVLDNQKLEAFFDNQSLEELEAFSKANFEATWNDLGSLSDEEKILFPDNATDSAMNSNPVLLNVGQNNPLLSSVAIEDVPVIKTELPSDDLFDLITDVEAGEGHLDFNLETPEPEEEEDIIVDFEQDKTEQKAMAEEVMSIHSYSQQPQQPSVQKPLNKVQGSIRVAKRQRKPVRHFDETSEESEDEQPIRKRHKSNSSSTSFTCSSKNTSRKVKLYEMNAFADPEMEKCRQNAINAKMNRDKKKNEKSDMQKEMSKLRRENEELKKKNRHYRTKLTSFEARLQIMESIIQSNRLGGLLKASGNDDSALSSSGDDDHQVIYY